MLEHGQVCLVGEFRLVREERRVWKGNWQTVRKFGNRIQADLAVVHPIYNTSRTLFLDGVSDFFGKAFYYGVSEFESLSLFLNLLDFFLLDVSLSIINKFHPSGS